MGIPILKKINSHLWDQRLLTHVESKAVASSIAGLVSHFLYYSHGEHHMSAPVLFYFYILLILAIFAYETQRDDHGYLKDLQSTSVTITAYALSLYTSIIIYRICFHRLRRFPGPSLARVSKLWHVYRARQSLNHQLMQDLHKKYGSFVRTGKVNQSWCLIILLRSTDQAHQRSLSSCRKPSLQLMGPRTLVQSPPGTTLLNLSRR